MRFKPSAGWVVAVIALFIAATGTATAARLISGKQIKNSSITGRDIKNKSLTPTDFKGSVKGDAGPQGVPGPPGPPGPVNTTTLTRITSAEVTVPPGQVGSTQAFCPPGMKVVSGGGEFITGAGNGMSVSEANDAQTGWFIVGANTSSVNGTVQAIAFCAESGKAVQPSAAATRAKGRDDEAAMRAKVAAAAGLK